VNKYFYPIFCLLLLSCGGEKHTSNVEMSTESIPNEIPPKEVITEVILTNDELANEAEKSAPWKNEPIVEFSSDEEIKDFLVLIDQIKDDFNMNINKKKNKITNFNFDKDFLGEINGLANYKLEVDYDDGQVGDEIVTDTTDSYFYSGVFTFNGFQNIRYSIHGTLKYKRSAYYDMGFHSSEDILDGGISFKNDLGVHTISIHLVEVIDEKSFDDGKSHLNTYNGSINGKEISGPLPNSGF
jgi:hypothetical protein